MHYFRFSKNVMLSSRHQL